MVEPSTDAKEVAHNRCQALQLVLNYYDKHQKFSGAMDDDCISKLNQFSSFAHEYTTSASMQDVYFQKQLKPGSKAY